LDAHHPAFSCPLCRTFADLEEDVEVEGEGEGEDWESEVDSEEEPKGGEDWVDIEGQEVDGRRSTPVLIPVPTPGGDLRPVIALSTSVPPSSPVASGPDPERERERERDGAETEVEVDGNRARGGALLDLFEPPEIEVDPGAGTGTGTGAEAESEVEVEVEVDRGEVEREEVEGEIPDEMGIIGASTPTPHLNGEDDPDGTIGGKRKR
jgi:E3 ubiquitin-protein ligase DMA1/2